jgi:hypothetical protein
MASVPDITDIDALTTWARQRFNDKMASALAELPSCTPMRVDEIADALADEGFAWTANDIRKHWKANK